MNAAFGVFAPPGKWLHSARLLIVFSVRAATKAVKSKHAPDIVSIITGR